jgi:hypothetical protein
MTGQQPIRASDENRESVVEMLCDAYAAGCLDKTELERRSGEAYCARTLQQLQSLTADLPVWLLTRPAPLQRVRRAGEPPRRPAPAWWWGFALTIAGFWLTVVALEWAPLLAVPLMFVWLLVNACVRGRPPRPPRAPRSHG